MGQTKSQPVQPIHTEKLEYVERLIYVKDYKVIRHDITNNKFEKKIDIQGNMTLLANIKDRDRTRIALTEDGICILTCIYKWEAHCLLSYSGSVEFLDREMNSVEAYNNINFGSFVSMEGILSNQIKEYRHCEQKCFLPKDFVIEDNCVTLTYYGESKTFRLAKMLVGSTYCQYDKKFIMCFKYKAPRKLMFQQVEKIDDRWLATSTHYYSSIEFDVDKINVMETSRKHLFISAVDLNGNNKIIIMQKNTFTELYQLTGWSPVYQDDYHDWQRKSTIMLKSVHIIEKMSEDVLKLILSYID